MVLSVAGAVRKPGEVVAEFDVAMAFWAGELKALSPSFAIAAAQRAQRIFEAVELSMIAEERTAGRSERDARDRAGAGGTRSKRAAARAAKRAEAVRSNPDLADDVETGELGAEQLDAIASAAEKTDGEAANDSELISEIREASPDEANRISARWLERRNDKNGAESRYARQRRRRSVHFGYDANSGCDVMHMPGDRETIEEMRRAIRARANEFYRADGGRDLPNCQHPRTHDQRMFDALKELTLGPRTNSEPKRAASPSPRSMLHVGLTVDDEAADQIRAETIGGAGLLPKSVLERYSCSSIVAGTVFDQRGQVLWQGRQKRHATDAQFAALIARDRGCVLCGAEVSRCEAHHLMPWHAPGKGQTNIDEMALLCADDHHRIHEQHLTLYRTLGPPGTKPTWATRPARPDETPNTN